MAYAQGNVGYDVPDHPRRQAGQWFARSDLRAAVAIVGGLAVAGAAIGLIWQAISPHTKGFVYLQQHTIVPNPPTESLVASDGRFMLLTAAVALVVSLAAWLHRSSRGPVVAAALALGGLLGAGLTDVVGRATGGGVSSGTLNTEVTLQVTVHARGLLLVEPALALFVYAICTLCAKRDDLGRAAEGQQAATGFSPPAEYQQPYQPAPWPSPAVRPEQ